MELCIYQICLLETLVNVHIFDALDSLFHILVLLSNYRRKTV